MKEVTRRVLVEEEETKDDSEVDQQAQEPSDSSDATESTETSSDSQPSNSTDTNSTDSAPIKEPVRPKYTSITELVPKNKTHTKRIGYEEEFIGHQPMSVEMKINATSHLVDLENRDKLIVDTMKAKNDYEALIYSTRDWISNDDNLVYITNGVTAKEKLLQDLVQNEDWLYEDGYDVELEVYQQRIDELNQTIGPIRYRQKEHELRSSILDHTKQFVKNMTDEIDRLHLHVPWIEEFKIERLRNMTENATEWFEQTLAKQEQLALDEDPVLTSDEIRENILRIGYIIEKLSKTPKPRDWDRKIREAQEAEAAKNGNYTLTNSTEVDAEDENTTETTDNSDETTSTEDDTENQSTEDPQDESEIKEDL